MNRHMKSPRTSRALWPLASSIMLLLALSACSTMPFLKLPAAEAVVYALGPRDNFTSPLNANLKPACQAFVFGDEGLELSESQVGALHTLQRELAKTPKTRLLVAGYAPPNLPQDHARSLSERRAQAVRQHLIELGSEPANIQTVGFGNDFSPTGPSSGVVVIYRQ